MGSVGRQLMLWLMVGGWANVNDILRYSYKLAKQIWRFPNEFAMMRMRYLCKVVEVGKQPV